MSNETLRQIKGILFIAMLTAAEVRQVQQRARFNASSASQVVHSASSTCSTCANNFERELEVLLVDPTLQGHGRFLGEKDPMLMTEPRLQKHANRVAEQLEIMMADPILHEQAKLLAEEMQAFAVDPSLQGQAKPLAEQIKATLANPGLEAEAKRVEEQLEKMMADTGLHEQMERIVEQIEAIKTHPNSREQAMLINGLMEKMKADPIFQEQMSRMIGQVKTLKLDPSLEDQAKILTEHAERIKADANFQAHVERVAELIDAMMANPKLQGKARLVAEQMEAMMTANGAMAKTSMDAQQTRNSLVDRLADNLVVELFGPVVQALRFDHMDLNEQTLGKTLYHTVPMSRVASQFAFSKSYVPNTRISRFSNVRVYGIPESQDQHAEVQITKGADDQQRMEFDSSTLHPHGRLGPLHRFAALADVGKARKRSLHRRLLSRLGIALAIVGLGARPASASVLSPPGMPVGMGDSSGLVQAFLLIFLSELGDKTFFIAGLLAAKYSKFIAFIGSVGALAVMTVISVVIGQIFNALPPGITQGLPIDDYVAVAAFLYFGAKTLYEAYKTPSGDNSGIEGERKEAEEAIEEVTKEQNGRATAFKSIIKTFGLVFIAEIGDRSFLSTIALSAALNPVAVAVGAIVAHAAATGVAVIGGELLSKHLSEKIIGYISGSLFLVFALTTAFGVF